MVQYHSSPKFLPPSLKLVPLWWAATKDSFLPFMQKTTGKPAENSSIIRSAVCFKERIRKQLEKILRELLHDKNIN